MSYCSPKPSHMCPPTWPILKTGQSQHLSIGYHSSFHSIPGKAWWATNAAAQDFALKRAPPPVPCHSFAAATSTRGHFALFAWRSTPSWPRRWSLHWLFALAAAPRPDIEGPLLFHLYQPLCFSDTDHRSNDKRNCPFFIQSNAKLNHLIIIKFNLEARLTSRAR